MTYELEVGELLYATEGVSTYATNDENLAVMEWETEPLCRLSLRLHEIIRSHALFTNYIERLSARRLVVKRLEMLPVTVAVSTDPHDTSLRLLADGGVVIPLEEATEIPGLKPKRLDMMVDTAQHVARTMRAHLLLSGVQHVELKLSFGVGTQGECLLQMVNPLHCNLGTTDYEALCTQLGGDPK